MKVKRFVAKDMRSALREIREELGADAVILSNRKLNGQVEILVALDYDEEQLYQAAEKSENNSARDNAAAYYEQAAAQRYEKQQDDKPLSAAPGVASKPQPVQPSAPQTQATDHQAAGIYQAMSRDDSGILEMRDELKSLRAIIENQQALSEWGQMAKQHPLRISLYKRFTQMGLSQDVCKYLVKGLDDQQDIEKAMQAALKQLVHQLPIADDDILNQGGVCAMMGPTGVGKTTTIAKLAARFAMRHGQRHVALISTDNYRIGAHEQLVTYGRLIGVPVYTAADKQELKLLLTKLYDKKLVLIDTAGMSQRDMRLNEQFVHLGDNSSIIKSYLVLAANAQLPTLNEVIKSFKAANLAGCILTKLDEAVSMGGVISALIKHHLPVSYVSHGQRVPEDLQPARARELVHEALDHMKYHREKTDDEFMAVAFSSDVSHAHL